MVQRIGVPPDMVGLFEGQRPPDAPAIRVVGLRPYERARDLEVLLFSSGSPVFTGVLVPGRWLPVLGPWARRLDTAWLKGLRPDVVSSVSDGAGPLALPLTMDGAVLVYRSDWWERWGLPPPKSLASLREALLVARSRESSLERPLWSDLPEDQLFWGLAWSYEGDASTQIYTYPKLHALRFMQEFELVRRAGATLEGEEALRRGSCAALFTSASRARALEAQAGLGEPKALAVVGLPSVGGRSHCIFNGWCLASPSASSVAPSGWQGYLSGAFQAYLEGRGLIPVARTAGARDSKAGQAMAGTVLHPAPSLGEQGDEIVRGAILDATIGPMSAEAALRRAQARIDSQERP